jgi:hypothetical protein
MALSEKDRRKVVRDHYLRLSNWELATLAESLADITIAILDDEEDIREIGRITRDELEEWGLDDIREAILQEEAEQEEDEDEDEEDEEEDTTA